MRWYDLTRAFVCRLAQGSEVPSSTTFVSLSVTSEMVFATENLLLGLYERECRRA